jgi:glutamine synthetase
MSQIEKKILAGSMARKGLLDAKTISAAAALVEQVQASDLETIRVLFADQHGILRGKTVVADAIASIFTSGIAAKILLIGLSFPSGLPMPT